MTDTLKRVFFSTQQHVVIPQIIPFLRRGRNLLGLPGPSHVNANVCDAIVFSVSLAGS